MRVTTWPACRSRILQQPEFPRLQLDRFAGAGHGCATWGPSADRRRRARSRANCACAADQCVQAAPPARQRRRVSQGNHRHRHASPRMRSSTSPSALRIRIGVLFAGGAQGFDDAKPFDAAGQHAIEDDRVVRFASPQEKGRRGRCRHGRPCGLARAVPSAGTRPYVHCLRPTKSSFE